MNINLYLGKCHEREKKSFTCRTSPSYDCLTAEADQHYTDNHKAIFNDISGTKILVFFPFDHRPQFIETCHNWDMTGFFIPWLHNHSVQLLSHIWPWIASWALVSILENGRYLNRLCKMHKLHPWRTIELTFWLMDILCNKSG